MVAKRNDGQPELTDFAAWQTHLQDLYRSLSRRKGSPYPRERRMNAFKDALYRYYRALKAAGKLDELEDFINQRDDQYWNPYPVRDKGALWVIRLPTAAGNTWLIKSATTRSRIATELDYADANDIAPDMLLAFLYEAGSTQTIEEDFAKGSWPEWAERYQEP